jgi:hypothetical protein
VRGLRCLEQAAGVVAGDMSAYVRRLHSISTGGSIQTIMVVIVVSSQFKHALRRSIKQDKYAIRVDEQDTGRAQETKKCETKGDGCCAAALGH